MCCCACLTSLALQITFLCPLITRETKDLVFVVIEFLRKLSVNVEYRAIIAIDNIAPALVDVVMADRQAEPLQKVRPALRFLLVERSVACWDAGSMTVPCVSCALFLCPSPFCMVAVPLQAALRLLFNLSFDSLVCGAMASMPLVSAMVRAGTTARDVCAALFPSAGRLCSCLVSRCLGGVCMHGTPLSQ